MGVGTKTLPRRKKKRWGIFVDVGLAHRPYPERKKKEEKKKKKKRWGIFVDVVLAQRPYPEGDKSLDNFDDVDVPVGDIYNKYSLLSYL